MNVSILIRFGSETINASFPPTAIVGDVVFDKRVISVFSIDPFNINVLNNGKIVDFLETIQSGETYLLEVAVNIKGLGMPKRHKVIGWLKRAGAMLLPAKADDHQRWSVRGQTVQINFKRGELDKASGNALADALELNLFQLIQHINIDKLPMQ